jgi:acetyl esterase/lipase
VAGDSAGGNISAVMAQQARDHGGPKLVFQLLWYPSTTGDMTLPSMIENADGPILDRDVVAAFQHWYLPPELDMSEPDKLPATLAPANAANLSGLPPAFIGTAEYDPLRDDGARYAELLTAAGVPVELYNAPTLVHGFVSFALVVPAATEATNRGLAALKAALHPA